MSEFNPQDKKKLSTGQRKKDNTEVQKIESEKEEYIKKTQQKDNSK